MSPTAQEVATLRAAYDAAKQGHVFTFWQELNPLEQSKFYQQLLSIDPKRVNAIYETAMSSAEPQTNPDSPTSPTSPVSLHGLSPPPSEVVGSSISNPSRVADWNQTGLNAVAAGQVGVLLMAGGQGTRLGSSEPKGCYDIGLPSHKSLFQLQAERIRQLEVLAGGNKPIPWYVMTSGPTRTTTEDFFQKHNYFGLKKEDVIFFEQGVLPCLTDDGKFFLESKSSIAVAPDGNGGVYAGLRSPLSAQDSSRTVLSDLKSRGILYVHAYCVDNCLVRVADPVFIGYCVSRKADCGAKVVKKASAYEAVGVVALRDGKFGVVEYSEIPRELSESTESNGDLTYRAANIANHFYTTDFLNKVQSFESEMAFHIARKKIPHVDLKSGESVKTLPGPNGMKLEQFVFDVFPFTESFALLEVARSTDFSPLKNAPKTGRDDAETSRRDLLNEQKRWLVEAGAHLPDDIDIELDPSLSYAGEGLESVSGLKFNRSGFVRTMEEFKEFV